MSTFTVERGILGAVLSGGTAAFRVVEDVTEEEHFADRSHRALWSALVAVVGAGQGVDVVAVKAKLEDRGIGELCNTGLAVYLGELLCESEVVDLRSQAERLAQLHRQREAWRFLSQSAGEASVPLDDPDSWILSKAAALSEMAQISAGSTSTDLIDVVHETFRALELATPGAKRGWTSGFPDVDRYANGLAPSDLLIVAARPGMGKTCLALNIATHFAQSGKGVLFATLEMSVTQLYKRVLASLASVDNRVLDGQPTAEEWSRITAAMVEAQPYGRRVRYDEKAAMTPVELASRARKFRAELRERGEDLHLVCVDYIQLMDGRNGQRNASEFDQVSYVSKSLKALAKELGVVVLAVSQLSRGVESRTDRRPMLSDLRSSGQLEQDADHIWFIYREDYYNRSCSATKRGVAEIAVQKARHGESGRIVASLFQGEHSRFLPLSKDDQEAYFSH